MKRIDSNKLSFIYENKNLIERVYKVTLSIECRFEENLYYVTHKNFVKTFRNYKLFDLTLQPINMYQINDQI